MNYSVLVLVFERILFLCVFPVLIGGKLVVVDNESKVTQGWERIDWFKNVVFKNLDSKKKIIAKINFYILYRDEKSYFNPEPAFPRSYWNEYAVNKDTFLEYDGPFHAIEIEQNFQYVKEEINSRPSEEFAFLIHGWTDGLNSFYLIHGTSWMPVVATDWRFFGDTNVIIVDWHELSKFNYYSASKHYIKDVAEIMYTLIEIIFDRDIIKIKAFISRISIAGHSLGAHAAGYFGLICIKRASQQVSRIYGLDPAGMNFRHKMKNPPNTQSDDNSQKLDFFSLTKDHAVRVYVLHTTTHFFGSRTIIGHYVYFANGSPEYQPDLTSLGPSHLRAINLFRASLYMYRLAYGYRLDASVGPHRGFQVSTISEYVFGIHDFYRPDDSHTESIFYMKTLNNPPYFPDNPINIQFRIPDYKVVAEKYSKFPFFGWNKVNKEVFFDKSN